MAKIWVHTLAMKLYQSLKEESSLLESSQILFQLFSELRQMASVLSFDADLYTSTICALDYSNPVIDRHTVLIFDKFLMNENW